MTVSTVTADWRVSDVMTVHPIVIGADEPASEAERLLKTHRVSGLPVVRGRDVVGVLSQADLVVARSSPMISSHFDRLLVRHLMTTPAITVHASATIGWCARQMLARHIHRLVVLGDDGHPVGIVTSLDLLKPLVDDVDEDAPN